MSAQTKTAPRWSFGQAAIAGGEAYGKHGGFGRDCKLDPHTLEILRPRLVEYLTGIGIELHRRGARLVGRCPVHNDRTPSFAVFGDGRKCGCWPCSFRGDVFSVSRWLGRAGSFPAAVADVAGVLGAFIPQVPAQSPPRVCQPQPRPEPKPFTLSVADREKIHAARLAFSDAFWGGDPIIDRIAESLGLTRETLRWSAWGSSGLGLSTGSYGKPRWLCYAYPSGLKWRNPDPTARPRFEWIVGRALYPWRWEWVSPDVREVFLTEGETDAMALIQAGLEADGTTACVAAPGTGFMREWGPLFAGRKVIICLDLDEPGRKATAGVAAILRPFAAEVLTWKGPKL